jgi:TRAP transporter TAXI family solute receptor
MRVGFWIAVWAIIAVAWPSPSSSAPPNWPASLTIGTASPGGIYYIYGGGLAPILNEALGIPVSAQATQGSDQNILLIERGDAQLGFATMGVALQAWDGTGEWTHGQKLRGFRALFPMYDIPFQFLVLRDSGIRSFAQMADKRIGAGPPGGTAGNYVPAIFKTLNIAVTVRNGPWNAQASQLRSGLLDVFASAIGVPIPNFAELDPDGSVEFVPPNDNETATLRQAMPELTPSVVSAGSYTALKTDYKTIGLYSFGVVSKDLPDDLVYAIVKAFYDNHDRMVQVHPAARESVVTNLHRNQFLPYHAGAVRYYRERGIELPAALASER